MSEEPIDPGKHEAEAAYERRMKAVEAAIDKYHGYLLDYLFRLTRQWQDAENLEQDLWKYVLFHFEESKIGMLPLLRRKAYQLFIDHYRKLVRRGETLAEAVPEQTTRTGTAEAVTEEQEAQLKERFWSEYPEIELSESQKEALWLHARYGFTYKEIEERLGIASSTVGDWIALARQQIAASMNKQQLL